MCTLARGTHAGGGGGENQHRIGLVHPGVAVVGPGTPGHTFGGARCEGGWGGRRLPTPCHIPGMQCVWPIVAMKKGPYHRDSVVEVIHAWTCGTRESHTCEARVCDTWQRIEALTRLVLNDHIDIGYYTLYVVRLTISRYICNFMKLV